MIHTPSSEVEIAAKYIVNSIKDDKLIYNIVVESDFIGKIKTYNRNETLEQGYETVRLAMHMALAKQSSNLTNEMNKELLLRCLVASRFYVLTDTKDYPYSKVMQNILNASRYGLSKNIEIMKLT